MQLWISFSLKDKTLLEAYKKLLKSMDGQEKYIKRLEMALDRKDEEIDRLKRRATFSISYVPNVAAAAPADFPFAVCEVCEKPVVTLFTLDPDYPSEQYCQGHKEVAGGR